MLMHTYIFIYIYTYMRVCVFFNPLLKQQKDFEQKQQAVLVPTNQRGVFKQVQETF